MKRKIFAVFLALCFCLMLLPTASAYPTLIEELNESINITQALTLEVGEGKEFTTLAAALTEAKKTVTPETPVEIQLYPGTYTCASTAFRLDGLIVAGVGDAEEIILTTTGANRGLDLGGSNPGPLSLELRNFTLKLSDTQRTTAIHLDGPGHQHLIIENLILDATELVEKTLDNGTVQPEGVHSGIFIFNSSNVLVSNVKFVGTFYERNVVVAGATNVTVEGLVDANAAIPFNILDYHTHNRNPAYPDQIYYEGKSSFLVALAKGGYYYFIPAASYSESLTVAEYMKGLGFAVRGIIDVEEERLVVDDTIATFEAANAYYADADADNPVAFASERDTQNGGDNNHALTTKVIAHVNPSGTYDITTEELTIIGFTGDYDDPAARIIKAPFTDVTYTGTGKEPAFLDFDFRPYNDLAELIAAERIPDDSSTTAIRTPIADVDGENLFGPFPTPIPAPPTPTPKPSTPGKVPTYSTPTPTNVNASNTSTPSNVNSGSSTTTTTSASSSRSSSSSSSSSSRSTSSSSSSAGNSSTAAGSGTVTPKTAASAAAKKSHKLAYNGKTLTLFAVKTEEKASVYKTWKSTSDVLLEVEANTPMVAVGGRITTMKSGKAFEKFRRVLLADGTVGYVLESALQPNDSSTTGSTSLAVVSEDASFGVVTETDKAYDKATGNSKKETGKAVSGTVVAYYGKEGEYNRIQDGSNQTYAQTANIEDIDIKDWEK